MKKITRKNFHAFLDKYSTKSLVLEIGGSNIKGSHSDSYKKYFPNRYSVDIDPLRKPDVVGDAHELPLSDNSHEYILCTEVLEHLHTPHKAIAEMYRVLKPGGTLVLTTRFVYPIHDAPNDYFRYTKYGLEHLFSDWDICELAAETQTMSAVGAIVQRVGFQTDVYGGKFTKIFIYALAWVLDNINWIVKKEYGDIKKTESVDNIMTTGYYLVVKKPYS